MNKKEKKKEDYNLGGISQMIGGENFLTSYHEKFLVPDVSVA